MTVMQFDTENDAKRCEERNTSKGLKSEPDYIYKAVSLSWGTDKINALNYYSACSGQQTDLIVAVVDSGLDSSNSCFNNKVVAEYDIYNNDRTPEDVIGHGTHVASTVADVTAGFNKVKIMPVKVFGNEDKTSSLIVDKAIDYAVSKGADVINLSLGGVSKYKERKSVSNAISKNITVVAAAGNDNVNMTKVNYYPACIPGGNFVHTSAKIDVQKVLQKKVCNIFYESAWQKQQTEICCLSNLKFRKFYTTHS